MHLRVNPLDINVTNSGLCQYRASVLDLIGPQSSFNVTFISLLFIFYFHENDSYPFGLCQIFNTACVHSSLEVIFLNITLTCMCVFWSAIPFDYIISIRCIGILFKD